MIDLIIRHFEAIAGSILFICFSSYIAWRTWNKQRFIAAADKFRNTILLEFEGLYPTPIKWPKEQPIMIVKILEAKYPRLEIAVTKFRKHLIWFKRMRFDKAWQEYHEDYFQYVPFGEGHISVNGKSIKTEDAMETYHDNFRKNVDAFLKFAK